MGIDGIKGPGGGAPSVGVGRAERSSFTPPSAGNVDEARGGAEPSAALAKLQAGEIGLDEYLDTQVEGAVAHLRGRLPTEQLDFVRSTLREQMEQDPVLVELVRRATGATG